MGRIVKASTEGAGRLVAAAVVTAKEEAARLLREVQEERAAVRAEAETRGFAAGLAAGREAAAAEMTATVVAAQAYAEALRARTAEPAALLARRMAEKVVGRALTLEPALMGDIVAQALAASRARAGAVVLRVHPEDLAAVERERPRWAERLGAAVALRVVSDPAVGRSGCVVETPVGRVDARLDVQLDALERALRP
jgi:flagellar biosynthesis/type III secretory pathway protein FliH